MLELFEKAGYAPGKFNEKCDVYVVNTCTVTGTGDKKSLQAVRRAQRLNPEAAVIVCGCLAQRDGEKLLRETGAQVVIGNARRNEVVALLEKALAENTAICAVTDVTRAAYEPLFITRHEGKTRAVLKIQEGCDRFCAYCIIPYVRGGIRSRAVEDVVKEAACLAESGYREVVLTGIHLTSYGRDFKDGTTLLTVIKALHDIDGVERIRLGSLEPVIANEEFACALSKLPKVCPQFHLALQSGCDTVLKRMRRRYDTAAYRESVLALRKYFPDCALTTDVLCGFPGETAEEHGQTLAFCREMGFARMHVFPYSEREGTLAATMPDPVPRHVREDRARELIRLGDGMAESYRRSQLGSVRSVLFETEKNGKSFGYTMEYMHCEAPGDLIGKTLNVHLTGLTEEGFSGEIC